MCRHLGYLGPAVPVGEPVVRGAHSLRVQAWAPREMRGGGTINADGFGIAWWQAGATSPTRYRNPTPIWSDPAVEEVLGQIAAPAVLAAVRSATPGMPVDRASCAPFVHEQWAFSHNGMVPDWRSTLAAVAAECGVPNLLDVEATTDSAALWLVLRTVLGVHKPEVALLEVSARILDRQPAARLNLLLGDGETIWATTCYHALSVLVTDREVIVASEPYDDDPGWTGVPDRHLVIARPGDVRIEPFAKQES
ncbi:ergothioneine biosynthesis protein EgtC [Aldersonia sp. NBC_00410]|uniref:ergothioneine biosynthesis protein EgtC n=1 Tax=Aldersonia sp. NBC_00410 TaxID=2975954 RepID=UPI002250CDED|nr:ergothioneine biosynthesis protein EgtC [Aldersonia sp. NBC_00410]MCX5045522.1 ergothioneine biosynthesis protein EgtC [Aldersonia sp. NBC_00410]